MNLETHPVIDLMTRLKIHHMSEGGTPQADIAARCLGRCLRRNAPYLFRSRPGLPERCPELLILPTLLRLIWRFPVQTRPWILAAQQGVRPFVHLRSAGEIRALVAAVEVGGADALLEAGAVKGQLLRR